MLVKLELGVSVSDILLFLPAALNSLSVWVLFCGSLFDLIILIFFY